MARERKDRSANWIIERHGASLLRLANISDFVSWKAAASVLSFPKQMPDGLLDVTFRAGGIPDPFLIEIESYPDQETISQLRDDAAMVLLSRGVLPDILLIVLFPKGNFTVPPENTIMSAHGLSELRLRIRVVNLWTLAADDLLATNDVGLVPWIPLTRPSGSPSSMLRNAGNASKNRRTQTKKGTCSPPHASWRKCDIMTLKS